MDAAYCSIYRHHITVIVPSDISVQMIPAGPGFGTIESILVSSGETTRSGHAMADFHDVELCTGLLVSLLSLSICTDVEPRLATDTL